MDGEQPRRQGVRPWLSKASLTARYFPFTAAAISVTERFLLSQGSAASVVTPSARFTSWGLLAATRYGALGLVPPRALCGPSSCSKVGAPPRRVETCWECEQPSIHGPRSEMLAARAIERMRDSG